MRPWNDLGDVVPCLKSLESKERFTDVGRNATVVKKGKGLNDSTSNGDVDRSEEGECCAKRVECECASSEDDLDD